MIEPADRHLALRDLEARHYRALLREVELGKPPQRHGRALRLHRRVPRSEQPHSRKPRGAASIGVWSVRPDGSVAAIVPNPTKMRRAQKGDWTVSIDEELIGEIATVRAQSLPRETGGVLFGVVDAEVRSMHIVDALNAPPDSVKENSGFERGIAGLENDIRKAMIRTMDQVRYVGEWHSHPPRYSTRLSGVDLTQLGWLAQVLSMENRPGMMLITGDGGINLLSGEIFS